MKGAEPLKVLAELLTYRTDVPQEGRIRTGPAANDGVEMRVSTFPTLHGERPKNERDSEKDERP